MLKNRALAQESEKIIVTYCSTQITSGTIYLMDFKRWLREATEAQLYNKFIYPFKSSLTNRVTMIAQCDELNKYFIGEDEIWTNPNGQVETHKKVLFDYQIFIIAQNDINDKLTMMFLVHENLLQMEQLEMLKQLLGLKIKSVINDNIKMLEAA